MKVSKSVHPKITTSIKAMNEQSTRRSNSASRMVPNIIAAVLAAIVLGGISDVAAAVKTWDGSSSANWGTSANWTPSGVPVDGDDVIFPAGALNLINTNNIADLRLGSITFNGAAGGYALRGNAITLSNGIVAAHTAGGNVVDFAFITNGASQTYTVDSGGTLDVNADIVFNGFNLTVNNDFDTRLDGQISGAGNLVKANAGIGTLFLGGAANNTYTGTTTVDQGTLDLNDSANATEMVPGDLVINDGGVVLISEIGGNQIADDSDVTINGTGLLNLNNQVDTIASLTMTGGTADSGTGTLTLGGNVTTLASATTATISGNLSLGGATRTFTVGDGTATTDLLVSAIISSAGGIIKSGAGTMSLTASNTYSGVTTINAGLISADDNLALGSTTGGTVVNGAAALLLNNAHVTNEVLTLNSINAGGALQVNATGDWIGAIVLNTDVIIEASSLLQLGGLISGPGGFRKVGNSTLRLIGANVNTYAGSTVVNGGILELNVNANNGAIPGPLTINGGFTARLLRGDQLDNSSDIVINTGGLLDFNGFSDIIGGLVMAGGTAQSGVGGRLRLNGNLTVNASAATSLITGELELFGSSIRTFNISGGLASPDFEISAIISGSGGITVNNSLVEFSRVVFSGDNTYSGLTTLNNDGSFNVQSPTALGSTAVGTVLNGPNMALGSGVIVGEALTNISQSALQGTLASGWTGPIVLNADLILQVTTPGYVLDLSGIISGSGGVTVTGAGAGPSAGTVIFSGVGANTYSGNTFVQEGTLQLAKLLAIQNSASLLIGDGVGGNNADVVQYSANNCLSASVPIIIDETGLLDLNGFVDSVGALTILGGDIVTGVGTLTMSDNLTATSRGVGNAASIAGNLALGASLRTFEVTNTPGPGAADMVITAAVSGAGGIVKTGDGLLLLSASNSFSGAVSVNDGDLDLQHDFAAGTTAGGVTVNGDATLRLYGNIDVGAEALTLNSSATSGALNSRITSNSWAGPVTLSANTTVTVSAGDSLNLLGAISGPGGLTKIGTGTLYFSGGGANSFAGSTTVNQGTLVLNKSVANGALTNDLVIGDGTGGVNADVVRLAGFTQIGNNASVVINSSGLLDLDGFGDAVGSIAGSGNLSFGSGAAFLNVGFDNSSTTFSGIISGTGDLTKFSGTAGTLTLSGNNTYLGATLVNGGTLLVNGSQPQSPVSVGAAGTLGGSGTVGIITASGEVAPGTSPGTLTSSNVVFGASGTFPVELNGTTPGSGHDQLNVRGTNNLTGAALSVNVGFSPTDGDEFRIINNDSGDAITGTFDGLPEGAVIPAGNYRFRVSYVGGTGNDVVLTMTNQFLKPGAAFVFSGNGNGAIEPDECNLLSLVVSNLSGVAMTGLTTTLRSVTPGVAVVQPFSTYPDIPAGNRRTNDSLFQVTTVPGFVCGTAVDLELEVATAAHGTLIAPFSLPSGVAGAGVRFNNNSLTAIPDASFVDSTVAVGGITTPLKKVVVLLHITHTAASDLDVSLIGPDGTTVQLTSDNGGVASDYGVDCTDHGRTTFDSGAATAITAAAAPFVGTFRPEQSLAAFNEKSGLDVNGLWTLRVTDDTPGAVGSIRCWSLILSPTACTPGSGICELCPEITINSAIGGGLSPLQTNYVTITGTGSTCAAPKVCPGTFPLEDLPYENFTFKNGPSDACITVTMENHSTIDMYSVTYLNSYDPANTNRCVNYLADMGNIVDVASPVQAYSFSVPSNSTFVVNVIAAVGAPVTPYRLTVSGGDCRPVLDIAANSSTQSVVDWTTAAVGYQLERTNILVSGVLAWPPVTNIPIVINSRFTVTNIAAPTANQFFRLRKPLP